MFSTQITSSLIFADSFALGSSAINTQANSFWDSSIQGPNTVILPASEVSEMSSWQESTADAVILSKSYQLPTGLLSMPVLTSSVRSNSNSDLSTGDFHQLSMKAELCFIKSKI
jgi:hypothetical protein